MATAAVLMSEEEYLRTSFESPEPDYVDGELVERDMPNMDHSVTCGNFCWGFRHAGLLAMPEIRVRVRPGQIRIMDIGAWARPYPPGPVPTTPPLVAVEIQSPDDKVRNLMAKLAEYQAFGVPNIWYADPDGQRMYVYRDGNLSVVPAYSLPAHGLTLTARELFTRFPE